jgi:putative membrane protein
MKIRLARVGLSLVGNAIGLFIAALVLDDMSVDGLAFVIAVVIFTVLTAVIEPLVNKFAERTTPALQGGSALLTTLLALIVTAFVSSGLEISGLSTWIIATVLVWLLTVIAGVILAKFLLSSAARS